jgi:hypothetical protein
MMQDHPYVCAPHHVPTLTHGSHGDSLAHLLQRFDRAVQLLLAHTDGGGIVLVLRCRRGRSAILSGQVIHIADGGAL